MGGLNVSTENGETFSSISNIFIDDFMAEANGDFVKVYIYLVRMFHSGKSFQISDLADHFNCTDNDILRAIKYWVRADVLGFTYDGSDNVTGIILKELKANPKIKNKRRKNIDITAIMSVKDDDNESVSEVAEEEAEEDSLDQQPRVVPNKTKATKARIEAVNYDENLQEILSQAEAYFDRTPTQRDIDAFIYIQDDLKFSFELMEYLLEYCADRKKMTGSAIEKEAIEWFKRGYTTREQAREDIALYRDLYVKIMKNLGISNRIVPTPSEQKYINKWIYDDKHTDEIIVEACKRANLAKPNAATFPYVNGILDSWKKMGVHTAGDIAKADEARYYTKKDDTTGKGKKDELSEVVRKLMG